MILFIAILELALLIYSFYLLRGDEHKETRVNFTNWLIFGVLLSLVPFVFGAIIMFAKGIEIEIKELYTQGELYLLAVAIGTASLGNLIASENSKGTYRIFAGGSNAFIVLCSAFSYALFLVPKEADFKLEKLISLSPQIFMITLLASGFSVMVSEYNSNKS